MDDIGITVRPRFREIKRKSYSMVFQFFIVERGLQFLKWSVQV